MTNDRERAERVASKLFQWLRLEGVPAGASIEELTAAGDEWEYLLEDIAAAIKPEIERATAALLDDLISVQAKAMKLDNELASEFIKSTQAEAKVRELEVAIRFIADHNVGFICYTVKDSAPPEFAWGVLTANEEALHKVPAELYASKVDAAVMRAKGKP